MKKKIISMLLILSLVIQCVPATAFASQGGDGTEGNTSGLLAEKAKTPEEIKQEAANGIALEKYDYGERTIDFSGWVVEGYELDTSQFADSKNIKVEDNNSLIEKGSVVFTWANKTIKFKVGNTDDDQKKIQFTVPLKKTDLSSDKYNIVLNVTIKNTKIEKIGEYNGAANGFKYSAKQLQIKQGPKTSAGAENTIFYKFYGDETDLTTKKIIIGEEWYNKGEKYQLVGAPPINKGKYELNIYIKNAEKDVRIAETRRFDVDINAKPVELVNLAAYKKPFDNEKVAKLNYDAARIDGTVGGETIKISETSKKIVKAEFGDQYVGKDKNVKLSGDKISAPWFELINGTGLASNYSLEEPTVKGEIEPVKRTIDLKAPVDIAQNRLIVHAVNSIDADTFKRTLEGAIDDKCLAKLKAQGDNLEFFLIRNGQEANLQGEKIELGKTYRIRVKAPNIDINKDASTNVNLNEYIGSTKDFTIIAQEEAKKITITKSDKIEYTGIPVNVTENNKSAENGLDFCFDGARPFYAWYEKNGAGWKQLTDRPIKPGSYKVEATSSNAGQVSARASETFEIVKKAIGIQSVAVSDKIYAKNNDSANVLEVTLDDNSTLDSSKYTILDATFTDANVGTNKKIDLTIALRDEGAECYMFKDNNSSIISSKGVKTSSGEIVEATFPGTSNETPIIVNVKAQPGVQSYLDLTDYLCHDFKIDKDKIKIGSKFETGEWKPILATESKGIKFRLKNDAASTEGESTITIPVTSANYRDYKIILNVTPEPLEVPKVLFRVSDRIIYNGGKKITFDKVEWGQSFSPIVDNGIEYQYSGNKPPQIQWYEADKNGSFDGAVATSNVPTKAGTYKVEFSFGATSTQAGTKVTKFVVVEERIANITDFELAKKTYDKSNKGDAKDVSKIVFKDSMGDVINDIAKNDTNGYSVDYISYGKASVGKDIPVTIKIHLNGTAAQNYSLKRDTFTADRGEIIKAKNVVEPILVKTQIGQEGSADLSSVITDNANIKIDLKDSNDIFKYVKYEGEDQEKPVNIIDNKLVYTIKDVDHIGSKKEGTVVLNVTDPNYEDYAITIKVTAVSQDKQDKLYITCGSALKFGESLKLSYSGGSGNGAVTFKIVDGGTGEAHIRENKADHTWYLDPIKIGKVEVYVVKASDDRYAEEESSKKTITISKGVAKGTPTFTPIVKPGVKLSTVVLGSNNMIPSGGEFKWSGSASTIVEKHKSYKWTYTPADKDKDNYAPVTGELVLYEKDDPNATKPNVELPAVPSSAAGKDSFGMTADQQANNKISIESMVADILQGVEHVVPADAETKRTEKAIQDETKKGQKIKIKVEARRVTEGQVSSDASKIKALLDKEYGKDKYTVVQYGAIAIKAQTEDKHLGFLTELNQRLSFTIQLPSGAYGYYHMARMHGGKAELLDDGDVTFDSKTKRVTFYADRFSTYLLFRTGPGGGDIPGTIDPNDPNNPYDPNDPNNPYDPNDPNNPNKPDGSNDPNDPNNPNKPGYIYPVTNIKLSTDHGLIKVSFKKSRTKNIKYYSIAYRPMKKCTCGRWHTAGKADYKGIKGTVTTIRVKKNVPYRIKVAAVTDYGSSIYKMGGIRYANRNGKRSARMYDADIYSSYSKKGSRSMTIKVRKIRYSNQPSPIMYQYFYKRKGTSKWHSVKTKSHIRTIRHLRRGKTYSVKVRFYYQSRLSKYKKVYSKYDYDSVKIR